jgi:hypothetical protein
LFDFGAFTVDHGVGFWEAIELRHSCPATSGVVVVEIMTRGFWEEGDAHAKDESPDPTDSHGNTVRACVVAVFGSVIDTICREDTNSNEQLVASENVRTERCRGMERLTRQPPLER